MLIWSFRHNEHTALKQFLKAFCNSWRLSPLSCGMHRRSPSEHSSGIRGGNHTCSNIRPKFPDKQTFQRSIDKSERCQSLTSRQFSSLVIVDAVSLRQPIAAFAKIEQRQAHRSTLE